MTKRKHPPERGAKHGGPVQRTEWIRRGWHLDTETVGNCRPVQGVLVKTARIVRLVSETPFDG